MIITAPAKINLVLDVIGDRPDGYHEVDMVMQSIRLSDRIELKTNETIQLTCTNPQVPLDRKNLAWRAAELLQNVVRERRGEVPGVTIHIEKKIPVAAGLAGGSTDAAGVLIGLNQLWDLGLSTEELMRLGLTLGADVPFCIMQHTARAEGIGEKLTSISSKLHCSVLLITPDIQVSTALVYQSLDTEGIRRHPDVNGVIAALETGDLERLCVSWGNVLEEVVLEKFPEVARLKRILRDFGLHTVLMSGSGPSVFALNVDEKLADTIRESLPSTWFCTLTEFL
ncbi:MAG TPA: 4-(cytidine 5'-diphospho)-2-C-methyl-D-erythritol kinase [Bacillota bacterium]|nr:4-(cytidine 5'-diphospho)-2-C-methyl-D-erythritol kinase [Bacillota bacterium]HPT86323.1 4-(cytidine 5'-diphospho)-2-C-methyl-D-erythritol kinase [Bacillota bacterium]